ncbi:MAG: 2-amino-4-hydroxy-6-hydroxymethyldihydropteridine diphosphokinase [Bacteroidota bacterium]
MANVFISLGSNQGDRLQHLLKGQQRLEELGHVEHVSSVYETEPWGFNSPIAFLNQVIQISTDLSAQDLMQEILDIEKENGRTRTRPGYSSRTIDIDILFYDDLVLDTPLLILPHPKLHERLFVLQPLAEIAPMYLHPVLNKPIIGLLEECKDDSWIEILTNAPHPSPPSP